MKRKLIPILLTVLGAVIYSCGEDDNLDPVGEWELLPATIVTPAASASVVLDADNPTSTVGFEWNAASNDENYQITYRVLFDEASGDFSDPIMAMDAENEGTALTLNITHQVLDDMLASIGAQVSEEVSLNWAVEAVALSKSQLTTSTISLTRFDRETVPEELYIAGEATEGSVSQQNGIPMVKLVNADNAELNMFEIYAGLEAGKTFNFYTSTQVGTQSFGGNSGELVNAGPGIVAPETGQYRIRADFNAGTYELFKIDKWSIVGNVIPGGWGGDVALDYQGNGVWSSSISLVDADAGDPNKRFIFRANGDWGVVVKPIKDDAENRVILESFANSNGYEVEDVSVAALDRYIITLDFSAPSPSFSMEIDDTPPAEAPDALFLFADGVKLMELTKEGDIFSGRFLDLEPGVVYTLNDKEDQTGNSYSVSAGLGEPGSSGDRISGSSDIVSGDAALDILENQAYGLTFDFANSSFQWYYYNFKLFHWNDWETRNEFVMNYIGNFQWETTQELTVGHNSKFITPWDFQFGSDSPTGLTGNLIPGDGNDMQNIAEAGTYTVTMSLNSAFDGGTYEFVKQ